MPDNPQKPKKLYRSKTNRVFFGICGGLGEYFNIDPILFRIIFVLLALAQGIGLILYIIAAFIIPTSPSSLDENENKDFMDNIAKNARDLSGEIKQNRSWLSSSRNILGIIIIIIGFLLFAQSLFPRSFGSFFWSLFIPIIVVILGLFFIIKRK